MKNFVITVARGFGSGGRAIAAKLADELNIHSYDNRILTLASQYSGYPEHYFKEADETLNGSLITKQLQALPKRHSPTGELSRFTSDDRLPLNVCISGSFPALPAIRKKVPFTKVFSERNVVWRSKVYQSRLLMGCSAG